MKEVAEAARVAGRKLSRASAQGRSLGLDRVAEAIRHDTAIIAAANQKDLALAKDKGLSIAMLDRLRLDIPGIEHLAQAVARIARFPDPLGQIVHRSVQPSGIVVEKRRIPLGVVAIIYESRPNVTADAAALCLRSGNAVILRGGSEAQLTNRALAATIGSALRQAHLPEQAVQFMPSQDREDLKRLLACADDIDVVIPRGGEGLIRFVTEHSKIPVIQHYRGNCHIFVERSADLSEAVAICVNAKASRPGVCNAAETILVDRPIAALFLPLLQTVFAQEHVEVRADAVARQICPRWKLATEEDLYAEFLALICAVAVVDDINGAICHIEKYGSSHTEAILTTSTAAADQFTSQVDSSTVIVNASTRFADGGELGLGAEIGISTSRLHAYGPMGAEELTTTKFVVTGQGQTRT